MKIGTHHTFVTILISVILLSFTFAPVNGNSDPEEDPPTIVFYTDGEITTPPFGVNISVNYNEDVILMTHGDELSVSKNDVYIIFFTGNAEDDHTAFNRLKWDWNITVPTGEMIKMNTRSIDLEIINQGVYEISLTVSDDEGGVADPVTISISVVQMREEEPPLCFSLFILPVSIVITLLGGMIILKKGVSSL